MNEKQVEKLNKLLNLLQEDTITPKELEQFIVLVLDVVKKSKDDIEAYSKDNLLKIQQAVQYIDTKTPQVLEMVNEKVNTSKSEIDSKVARAIALLDDFKRNKPKDGKPGKPGKNADEKKIVSDVLSKIVFPEIKETTPEEIVKSINSLPTGNDDFKIDASHIKNFPEFGGKANGGGWRNLFQLHDVELTDVADNDILQYDSATSTWKNVTPQSIENVLWGEITGTITDQTDLVNYIDSKIATVDTLNEISLLSNTTAKSLYQMTSGANVEFRASDGNTLTYWDNANKRFGVGTSSIRSKFEVLGAGSNTVGISTSIIGLQSTANAAHQWGMRLGATSGELNLDSNFGGVDVNIVKFERGGNVGIGVTSVSAKLHVVSTTEQLRLGYDTTNRLSITVAATGSTTFALNGTSPVFTFSQSVLLPSGTVSAPAIGFASETNSGWYRSGAGVINLSVLGTSVLSASSSALTSTNVILAPSGTVSAPSFSFASETNSGWYRAAAGTIGLSIGGTQKISVTATETRSDNNFLSGAAGSNLTVLSTTPRIQGVTTSGIAISSIGVADGTNNRRIGIYVNQTAGELGISYTRSSGAVPFYIKDVSTNRLLIDINGNVGINLGAATTADTNLHVLGTGFPVGLFERQVTNTNSGGSALGVRTTSTGDMVDGFGTGFTLQIEDTAGVANPIANFFASRNGADNTGKLAINVYNAGSVVEAITALNTGSIGMGASPDASAQLDVTSTSKGFLPPRMTGAQGEAIGTPATGLMIYATSAGSGDITAAGWWGYNGANWVQLG